MKKILFLIIVIAITIVPQKLVYALDVESNDLHAMEHNDVVLTPQKLKRGDKVGVIAPANPGTCEKVNAAIQTLKKFGFIPVISDDIGLGFTGDPTGIHRANAFNKLVADNTIKAIICLRGGYGSVQILDKIDYEKFRENRPILVGYSDITALHNAIYLKSHVVTFHGPMLSSNDGQDESFKYLFNMLTDNLESSYLKNLDNSSFKVLKSGVAKGQIVGGNLVLLGSLMGTEYEIDTSDKILFIEELEEPLYKLDRILQQLKLAGKFNNISGIVIGDIYKCDDGNGIALAGVLEFFKKNVSVPVIYNVHAGHDLNPMTIPLGAKICINDNCISIEQCVVEQREYNV